MTDQQQQQSSSSSSSSSSKSFGEVVVARAGSYYRNTRYLMAIMCVGGAIWFGLDGWKNWPESTRKFNEVNANLLAAQDAHDTEKIRQYSEEQKQ